MNTAALERNGIDLLLLNKHEWTSTEKLLKFLTGWVHFVMHLNITKYSILTPKKV